jgi:hypothetical membrane protein
MSTLRPPSTRSASEPQTPHALVRSGMPPAGSVLLLGVIAPVLFALVFLLDGAVTAGYSAADEAISYLDLGPHGWLQRANFILFGVLLLVFLAAFTSAMRPLFGATRLRLAIPFFVLSDFGWVTAGLFVPNPYLAPQVPWPGILHQFAVIVAFLPFAFASVILGTKAIQVRGWRVYGVYSILFALPLVVFSVGTIAYLVNQNTFGNVNSPGSGTMNRVALIVGPLAWYAISALLALRYTARSIQST